MDLRPDETQTYLQQAVSGAVARHASPATVRGWLTDGDLEPADRLAAAQGWTGIGLAEDVGGQGGGLRELMVVAEQLGRGAVPWDRMLAGHLAGSVLAGVGEHGREWAASTAGGSRVAVLCFDPRSPLDPPDVRVAGDRCSGRSAFTLGAVGAEAFVVAQPTDGGDLELFLVERDAQGTSVTPRHLVDATRALADVQFADSPAELLGAISSPTWQKMIDAGVVLSGADSLGAAARLLEMTTEYVQERTQFGVAVGSFQAVKHMAAEMLVDVESIRSAVQYGAWAVETAAEDSSLHASVAGMFCSQAAPTVADRALFLHGAIGYTWEHDLQLLFKRIKSNAELFGSAAWHREQIAGALGRLPAPV